MFDKALIALDLSPAELPLLDCLPGLSHWGIRKLVLFHVIRFGYGHGAGLAHNKDYVAWLEGKATLLRDSGFEVEVQVTASGEPAASITEAADSNGADLIMVGSRSQNLIKRLFLGSVAREVIRTADRPVLLEWVEPSAGEAPARCEAVCIDSLNHVVFATDFSDHAQAAEHALIALAPRSRRIQCVHVLSHDSKATGVTGEHEVQSALEQCVDRIRNAGGQVEGQILKGRPSTEIAQFAANEDATLIIVGKHGQNRAASKVIGTTAEQVCENAGRPVLMVP